MLLITQPTFIPWIGYFDLIDQSEATVFLDDVKFSKQSWQQRNNFKTPLGLKSFTIPVTFDVQKSNSINKVLIANKNNLLRKFENFLISNYKKSKFFDSYFDSVIKIFSQNIKNGKLIDLNLNLIIWFMKILKIKKKIFLSSELNCTKNKSAKIIEICNQLKYNNYLSTAGSSDYLSEDLDLFKKSKINIHIHNYKHPIYSQNFDKFCEYACILDLIFNEGEASYNIIKSGRKKNTTLN
tara:strand:+ start:42725 stop:43441 length:717 start_codon:yes stop_codon:yes gene_type:complete